MLQQITMQGKIQVQKDHVPCNVHPYASAMAIFHNYMVLCEAVKLLACQRYLIEIGSY